MLNQILGYDKYNEVHVVIDARHMIIVADYDNAFFYGYDIVTDKFSKIKRHEAIPLPPPIIDLIRNEKARVKFAQKVCKTRKQCATLLNINERTYYRLLNEYALTTNKTPKKLLQK